MRSTVPVRASKAVFITKNQKIPGNYRQFLNFAKSKSYPCLINGRIVSIKECSLARLAISKNTFFAPSVINIAISSEPMYHHSLSVRID